MLAVLPPNDDPRTSPVLTLAFCHSLFRTAALVSVRVSNLSITNISITDIYVVLPTSISATRNRQR